MSAQDPIAAPHHIVVTSTKSVGIQILLIIFLGPLGLFYSTIKGALIMLFGVPILVIILSVVAGVGAAHVGTDAAAAVGFLAFAGLMALMCAVWWIGSFIWGIVAVNKYNANLLRQAGA